MYRQLHIWLFRGVWRLRDVSRLRRIRGGALRRVFMVQAWFLIESWKHGYGRLALNVRHALKWHLEDENVAVLLRGRLLGTAGARTPQEYTALLGPQRCQAPSAKQQQHFALLRDVLLALRLKELLVKDASLLKRGRNILRTGVRELLASDVRELGTAPTAASKAAEAVEVETRPLVLVVNVRGPDSLVGPLSHLNPAVSGLFQPRCNSPPPWLGMAFDLRWDFANLLSRPASLLFERPSRPLTAKALLHLHHVKWRSPGPGASGQRNSDIV
ncbi:hypothetical protein [Myxococcus xanthus]|uniref:hypothetical protein n=1 Tax=Myxococcus xanthus TaxID=34 RepID=UPI00191E406C|nr:hypothetical protein [Myxococcus xanthus]